MHRLLAELPEEQVGRSKVFHAEDFPLREGWLVTRRHVEDAFGWALQEGREYLPVFNIKQAA